ncbi:hypothetical protein NQZ68_007410 [Dissostichus eleginoides]|nr:hypothetical protein NQZ68_007410 [Dissostichus eleginoides]
MSKFRRTDNHNELTDWAPLCHAPRTIHEPSLSPAISTGVFSITAAEVRGPVSTRLMVLAASWLAVLPTCPTPEPAVFRLWPPAPTCEPSGIEPSVHTFFTQELNEEERQRLCQNMAGALKGAQLFIQKCQVSAHHLTLYCT